MPSKRPLTTNSSLLPHKTAEQLRRLVSSTTLDTHLIVTVETKALVYINHQPSRPSPLALRVSKPFPIRTILSSPPSTPTSSRWSAGRLPDHFLPIILSQLLRGK